MKTLAASLIAPGDSLYMIDVRDPQEYDKGHIPGSLNVPLATIRRAAEELKAYPRIIVVCGKGQRAAQAGETLTELGLTQVTVLEGGIEGWTKAGRKLTTSPKPFADNSGELLKLAGLLMLLSSLWRPLRLIAGVAGLIIVARSVKGGCCLNLPATVQEGLQVVQNPLSAVGRLLGWRIERI